MVYNVNLNYVKFLKNTDVKVLQYLTFRIESYVMSRAIFIFMYGLLEGVLYDAILSYAF
jgi:hypothetical protein